MIANDRRSRRHSVLLETRLMMTDGTLVDASMRNISLDGAYLLPSHHAIPLHSLVDLSLELDRQQFHIQAMVVHNNEAGTGLMFRQAEPTLYQRALNATKTPFLPLPPHLYPV